MSLKSFLMTFGLTVVLSACVTTNEYRVFHNTPLKNTSKNIEEVLPFDNDPSILWVTAISGGGTRAASFAYGVLEELKNERHVWGSDDGVREQSLLSQIDYIRGVSGGSVIASYYALNGEDALELFRKTFLEYDFQGGIIKRFFNPTVWSQLNSRQYGRGHVLAKEFERLFLNKTFKDLQKKSYAHLTIVGADLVSGMPFEFSPTQFDLMCSNLSDVPISLAVAASSSVPLVFSPITFENFSNQCDVSKRLLGGYRILPVYNDEQRHYKQDRLSYLDPNKKYIHVVDGGLADNLGIQGVMNHLSIALGDTPLRGSEQVRDLVLLVINGSKVMDKNLSASSTLPSIQEVAQSMMNTVVGARTRHTLASLTTLKENWSVDLLKLPKPLRNKLSSDVRFHLLILNLSDFGDLHPGLKNTVLSIPTTFSLSKKEVDLMIRAGHEVLRFSKDYQLLKTYLKSRSQKY